jgi:hypothetical protein
VSIIHTGIDDYRRVELSPLRAGMTAIRSFGVAAKSEAVRVYDGFRHRRTMHRISRLSDHRLDDIGFERDWDGAILPTRR